MLEFFIKGGPFMYMVTLFGLGALALNLVQIATRGRRDFTAAVLALAAAAFFTGVMGTGAGMYVAGGAIGAAEIEMVPRLFGVATGIALITTTFGAAWASLNALLCGVARMVRVA